MLNMLQIVTLIKVLGAWLDLCIYCIYRWAAVKNNNNKTCPPVCLSCCRTWKQLWSRSERRTERWRGNTKTRWGHTERITNVFYIFPVFSCFSDDEWRETGSVLVFCQNVLRVIMWLWFMKRKDKKRSLLFLQKGIMFEIRLDDEGMKEHTEEEERREEEERVFYYIRVTLTQPAGPLHLWPRHTPTADLWPSTPLGVHVPAWQSVCT